MKPDPLASWGSGALRPELVEEVFESGRDAAAHARVRVVALARVAAVWIETTAGVTCSAIATNELLASASGLICCVVGFPAVGVGVADWA